MLRIKPSTCDWSRIVSWRYRISLEDGGRNTKTPAFIAGTPFPFPQWRLQGRGPGVPPALFLDQNEARRAGKNFFWDWAPPFLKVWMTGLPLPPPPLSEGLDLPLFPAFALFSHPLPVPFLHLPIRLFTKRETGSVFPAFCHATFHHALIACCKVSQAGYISWCIMIGIHLILVKATWRIRNQPMAVPVYLSESLGI